MNELGMDVDAMQGVAKQVASCSDLLQQTLTKIDGLMRTLPGTWTGADAQRFSGQTWPPLRSKYVSTRQELVGLVERMNQEIADQRQASSVGSSTVILPGFVQPLPPSGSKPGWPSDSDSLTTVTGWNGTVMHVVTHPDGSRTVTDDAQDGLHGALEGKLGADAGNLTAEGSVHGEAGIRVSETTDHDLGGGAAFSDTGSSFVGAEGSAHGIGSVGLDGAKLDVGANAFVGADESIDAKISGGGVGAGIGAGLLVGVGAMASGHAEINLDHISIGGEIGASLGFGFKVKPSIEISPKQIINELFGVHW